MPSASAFLNEPEKPSASAFLDEGNAAPSASAFLDETPDIVSGGHTSVAPPVATTPTAAKPESTPFSRMGKRFKEAGESLFRPSMPSGIGPKALDVVNRLGALVSPVTVPAGEFGREVFMAGEAAERGINSLVGRPAPAETSVRAQARDVGEQIGATMLPTAVGIPGFQVALRNKAVPYNYRFAGKGATAREIEGLAATEAQKGVGPGMMAQGAHASAAAAGEQPTMASPEATRPQAAVQPPAPAPATTQPEIGPQTVTEQSGLVSDIVARHTKNGGSTTELATGRDLAGQKAYAVSPFKDLEAVFDRPITPADVAEYRARVQQTRPEALETPGASLGTWTDQATGKNYIDISVTTPDLAKAIEIGRQNGQKAIYDLGNGQEIPVPKMVRFEHYTDQPGLEKITAERYGQGALSASEKARQSPPGSYLYKEGAKPEPKVLARAKERLTVEIPEDQIGDITKLQGTPTEREAALAAEGKTYAGPEYPEIYKSFAKELRVVGREPVAAPPVRGMPGIELVNPKTGEVRTIQPKGMHVSGLDDLSPAERADILAGRSELRAGRFDANGRVEANPTTTTRFYEYLDTLAKREQSPANAARLQGLQPPPGKPGPVADVAGPAGGNPPERVRAEMGAPPGREPVASPQNVRPGPGVGTAGEINTGPPPISPGPPPFSPGQAPGFVTSARQGMLASDRAALGLEDSELPAGRGWSQALATAKAQQIPERALDIAKDITERPRALSDVETGGLVIRANDLKNQHAAAMDRVGRAMDPADIRMAAAETTRIEQDFELLSRALKSSGSEKGRALAAQKLTIDQDFRLISVLNRAKAAKGGPLSAKERTRFETLVRQIEDMTNQLKTGVFTPKAAKPRPALPKEIERLTFQRDQLQKQIRDHIQGLKPKTIWGRTSEPLNAARAIETSLDFSAVFRQGGFIALGNPVRAAKALGPMFKAFASPQAMFKMEKALLARPNAPLYARAKLHLSEIDHPSLSMQEEVFMSRLVKKIPGVHASARAYTMFLNRLRADSFDAMVASLARNGEVTEMEARAIANFINVATGRGNLGQFEEAATGLNSIFFAPRYVASRFQLLAGEPLYKGTARTRMLIAKEYGKFLAGLGVVYGLGTAAGASVEVDPRSADFGKLKFGNTRLDPLSGLSQVAVLTSRLTSGKTKQPSGNLAPIRGPEKRYGQSGAVDIAARFVRSKLSPPVAAAVNIASGETVMGEEATPASVVTGLVTPLAPKDVYEAIKEQGVPPGVAMGLMGIFGMGLQTYESRTARKGHAGPFAFFKK